MSTLTGPSGGGALGVGLDGLDASWGVEAGASWSEEIESGLIQPAPRAVRPLGRAAVEICCGLSGSWRLTWPALAGRRHATPDDGDTATATPGTDFPRTAWPW